MRPARGADAAPADGQSAWHGLTQDFPGPDPADFERRLAEARPRLVRLARAYGVASDAAEDAAQETLLVAWRRSDQLSTTERLDAWLNSICHHVAQHAVRTSQQRAHQTVPLMQLAQENREGVTEGSPLAEEIDLDEALHREDLERLLDQALAHLSESAREIIELCYLSDLPQREVAARLGITLSSLEARLHRTRLRLRQLVHGELRPAAEELGLLLDANESTGWRETREWCNFCGRRRLRGTFEPLANGAINFRLRCPDCSQRFGGDIYSTGGLISFSGARAFRPALRRLIRMLKEHYATDYVAALRQGWQPCPGCKTAVPVRLIGPGGSLGAFADQVRLIITCPRCGMIVSPAALAAYWTDATMTPLALAFVDTYSRWRIQPDASTEYDGRAAFQFRMVDTSSAAQLTLLADARTLQVLAVHQQ
jgi:RNA polymerase sigma factor (sigma-70 family)